MRLNIIVIISLFISLISCENYIRKRVVFSIGTVELDRSVVAQGQPVNLSAVFIISGSTNESKPSVVWESNFGDFENPNIINTIWIAPTDFLGDTKIKLTATFMGHTDIAETGVRIVKTPADDWGSVSGYAYQENETPLVNIIVSANTGERDTTDANGYFYLADIPRGNNGLEFYNIPYAWSTELLEGLTVTGGIHQHLGNIILYFSTPAEIKNYQKLPDRNAILFLEHRNIAQINFHELYQADDVSGTGSRFVRKINPEINELQVKDEYFNAYYALRSVPLNGERSPYSEWIHVELVNAIDPDADASYFEIHNFFTANLKWQPTGFEEYNRGFKVVENTDTGWAYISPLLPVDSLSYRMNTIPGQTGNFYVIAISDNFRFNENQPMEQLIPLEVPQLETPVWFRGTLSSEGYIRLNWEPVATDNTWYSGYYIEKMTVPVTGTGDWEDLTRISSSETAEYLDIETASGNTYFYRISSVAYPPEPGSVYYSATSGINISTK